MSSATVAAPAKLKTIGEVAREHDQPVYRIEYAIRSRQIAPASRAGRYRVFDAKGVRAILKAIQEINDRQAGAR